MKIAFFSNFLNHHQLSLCQELYNHTNGQFRFVATTPIEEEYLNLGYTDMNDFDFVIREYESEEQKSEAILWCEESDIVIHGSAPEEYVKIRMKLNKPVFRYCERIFKDGIIHAYTPKAIKNLYKYHGQYRKKPLYLLCSSAYTAMDFHRAGVYERKAYKWGYFPEVKRYDDIESLLRAKNKSSILWAGRMVECKHPDIVIDVAKRLKQEGYSFSVNLIGTGHMKEELKKLIVDNNLSNQVKILGPMSPDEVRKYMEESEIYLFTSDFKEGWGAVLSESMNSGCAVVSSHAIGSAPFLIDDKKNGLIYKNGDFNDLYNKVKFLLDNPSERISLGLNAYRTMIEQWNSQNAAKRFFELAQALIDGKDISNMFDNGVCSKAPLLRNNWYKK